MTQGEIEAAARALRRQVGYVSEDTWSHPATLAIVRWPTGKPAKWFCGPKPEWVVTYRRPRGRGLRP